MKYFSSVIIWGLTLGSCIAGDVFFQMRQERTRCCIPTYDYRIAQRPAVSAVTSESAIVLVKLSSGIDSSSAESVISEQGRAFVAADVSAGPAEMKEISASVVNESGIVRLTGTLNHTGGDSKHLQGGRVVVKMQPLASPGESGASSLVLGEVTREYWIRPGIPQAVILDLGESAIPTEPGHEIGLVSAGRIQTTSRVRVYLEYHPSR